MAKRYRMTLTEQERAQLKEMSRTSKTDARKFLHGRVLLLSDRGEAAEAEPWKVADISQALGISPRAIEHIKERFVEEGLEAALGRKASKKQRPRLTGSPPR